MIAPFAIESLKEHRVRQLEAKLKTGASWQEHDYVFCTILDPRIQTKKERCVRYNKEHEKTLYSVIQSSGGARAFEGRQNDCADRSGI